MTELEIQTNHIQVPNGDLQIDSYLAQPIGEGPFPAVIVVQEIFGCDSFLLGASSN
ncbi:hypothetical protein [Okeania sp.]|uniref:hypothetical protein n=1 Tax=Okeania sp. TaxID=3100323 RepID=UPI002B4AB9C8|nr:hypothetical protein [Okeania sp.]MEB3342951.1 hypothetical protein [Okeania sp.]